MSDYYKSKISKNMSNTYDICLISGWIEEPKCNSYANTEFEKFREIKYAKTMENLNNLNIYLAKYMKNNSGNMVICLRSQKLREKHYYEHYYERYASCYSSPLSSIYRNQIKIKYNITNGPYCPRDSYP